MAGLVFVCGIFLGPITPAVRPAHQSATVQVAHILGLALYSYASDDKGLYPDGTSSTEVFQKLVNGGYISDPTIFYVAMDGKTPLHDAREKLKPENVCWDVTGGVSTSDSGSLPLVYLTGFRMTFAPGGGMEPLDPFPPYQYFRKDGLAAYFVDNTCAWLVLDNSNRTPRPEHFLPPDFNRHGKTYRQLTPDGVLR